MAGIGYGELFQLVIDLGALAHAGGIDQADPAVGIDAVELFFLGQCIIMPDPVDGDAVAGNARFRTGNQPVLVQHLVDQGRLAGIGAPDNGQFQRRGFVGRFVRSRCLEIFDIGLDRLEQVGHAVAMFRAERNRIAKTQGVAFQNAGVRRLAFCLVDQQYHRRLRAAQPAGNFLVQRRQPGAAVDHENRQLCARDGQLRLLAHPSGQAFRIFIFIARRVDDVKFQAQQIGRALAAVAGDAGHVVDERQLLANQTVEQRRFADIGSTYDCNIGQHKAGPCPLVLILSGTRKCGRCRQEYIACHRQRLAAAKCRRPVRTESGSIPRPATPPRPRLRYWQQSADCRPGLAPSS